MIGLGKLGSSLAACFAAKGHKVTGVDLEAQAVDAINQGLPPVYEPGLSKILAQTQGRLSATLDATEAVANSDVTFIVVPTPSGPDKTFTNKYIVRACESVANGLAEKQAFHLIVLVSTVMPGSTGGEIQQTLERGSGKSCGVDFGLCYGPVFVALGSVVRDFLNPDYLLIGESDTLSGDLLESLYKGICDTKPPVARMNYINAELTKLANNTFISTKITFGNMLSQICERLPETNVDVVSNALGLDSRIGAKYLKGGFGYGGPCLVRDNLALSSLAVKIGAKALLADATDQANLDEVARLASLVMSKIVSGGVVGILGLSYKPETNVIDYSPGLLLAQALAEENISVVAFDPAAMEQSHAVLGKTVRLADSMESCIKQADVVVITTPWNDFKSIKPDLFDAPENRILIDCWRVLDQSHFNQLKGYIGLGIGPSKNRSVI